MAQAVRFRRAIRRAKSVGVLAAVVALALTGASCKRLIVTKDRSIPKLITPLANAKFDDLIKQLQPFTNLQSLRTSRVGIVFMDAGLTERWPEADAIMVLQRPDKIRLIIQAPVVKSKVAEMVSESNHFKVAIYQQSPRFLIGTNDADYGMWREKLGEKGRSGLVSARPFHFTEALIEEPDSTPKAAKGARVLRSFYVISEIELGQGTSRVLRRFWFDRTNNSKFTRQQIFDVRGELATDVTYTDYRKLSEASTDLWPSVILVSRPHDDYAARLLFSAEKFELNPELPAGAFTLENTEKLAETDLDKPPTP